MVSQPSLSKTDGLPVRETGPWVHDKYRGLDRYSEIFTTAMRAKWRKGVVFVDLMAGPGICVDTRTAGRPECSGSTLRALETKYPFDRIIALDKDPEFVSALKNRTSAHPRARTCFCYELDCNGGAAIQEVREATRDALSLVFVDLLGTEVHMRTLEAISKNRAMDFLITWPEMDVVRNASQMTTQSARWTAFFGTNRWRQVLAQGPGLRLRRMMRLYRLQLEGLGYRSTFSPAIKNRRGGRLYRPLFASRKSLGLEFWDLAALDHSRPPLLF